MPSLLERITEFATDKRGYITTRQARELGIDPTQLRLMAVRGQLEHPARGVYRVPFTPAADHDDLAKAVAWSRGRGVVSHGSALHLYGLLADRPALICLTVPRDNHPRAAGSDRYRIYRRDLHASDITEHHGIAVTTIERALRECAAEGLRPELLAGVADRAVAAGLLGHAVAYDAIGASPEVRRTDAPSVEPRKLRFAALSHLRHRSEDASTPMSRSRLAVLDAFMRLAVIDGYSGVTMRTLAGALKMKAPSLYSHFPGGRDQIAAEALRWNCFAFAQSAVQAVDGVEDADEFFDALVRNHALQQFALVQNDIFDLIVASDRIGGTLPSSIREEVLNLSDVYRQTLFAAALDIGFTGDVALVVDIAITVLDGVTSWTRNSPGMTDEAVTRAALTTVRAVLSAHSDASRPRNALLESGS